MAVLSTPRRLAAAAALALAIALPASTTAQPAGPLIRVGAGPDDQSTPLIYAARAGLFAKAGLNVELEKLAGAAVVGAALAGGSLEIGKASSMSVVTAYAKGLPFTVIGSIGSYNSDKPDLALIVLANSEIKTAKDLIGKTLADVSLQDMNTVATLAWLDQHGVDSSMMKYVEIPASAALPAMEESRVVGSTVYEPVYSADMATGKVRVIGYPFDAIGKHFADAVMFANVNWVSGHRDLVERFLRVMQTASAYVGTHETEMVPVLAQFAGADPAALANIRHPGRGVAIGPADLQPVIDLAAKYKVIPKAFSAQEMICSCALRR